MQLPSSKAWSWTQESNTIIGTFNHWTIPPYYSSNTLATWCEEPTWKRPCCWERLKAGGEGDDRGWDGWMASSTQWTWVWASSGRWWRNREACRAAVYEVAKSRTWLRDSTTTTACWSSGGLWVNSHVSAHHHMYRYWSCKSPYLEVLGEEN